MVQFFFVAFHDLFWMLEWTIFLVSLSIFFLLKFTAEEKRCLQCFFFPELMKRWIKQATHTISEAWCMTDLIFLIFYLLQIKKKTQGNNNKNGKIEWKNIVYGKFNYHEISTHRDSFFFTNYWNIKTLSLWINEKTGKKNLWSCEKK